jgi:hypothetical protein
VLCYDVQNAAIAPVNTTNFIFGAPAAARPIFVDTDGSAITGAVNTAQLAARPGTKLLILHHHNAPVPLAEVVNVSLPIAVDALGEKAWMHMPIALR